MVALLLVGSLVGAFTAKLSFLVFGLSPLMAVALYLGIGAGAVLLATLLALRPRRRRRRTTRIGTTASRAA